MSAVEAIHRAVEFNPHVPPYLLQVKYISLVHQRIFQNNKLGRIQIVMLHIFQILTDEVYNPTARTHFEKRRL